MFVRLIGVDHRIQWIPQTPGPWWSECLDKFRDFIAKQALEVTADLIAEEFSEYLLNLNHALDSTSRRAAEEIGLPHLFCDHDPAERGDLDISENTARELEWLRKLKPQDTARSYSFVEMII